MRKRMTKTIICLTGCTVLLLAAGCRIFQSQPDPVQYYTLSYDKPEVANCRDKAVDTPLVIRIKRLDAAAPYNTNHIIYAPNRYERSEYAYQKWIKPPSDIMTPLLVRDIENSGIAETVGQMPSGKNITHRIEGTIIDFYENDKPDDWEAVLALRLSLTHIKSGSKTEKVIFTKTYREEKKLAKNNPHALARAMSEAMKSVSVRFIDDICKKLP